MQHTSPCVTYEITKPIGVPETKKGKYNTCDYGLKENFFDPKHSSPPNDWGMRLFMRLGQDTNSIIFPSTERQKNS